MFKSSMCHLYYHDLTSFLLKLDIICILCYASFSLNMVGLFVFDYGVCLCLIMVLYVGTLIYACTTSVRISIWNT